MTTLITHPAPIIASAMALGSGVISPRLFVAGVLFSILPDLDAVSFLIGIPYEHILGHRGFSHSMTMVIVAGLLGLLLAPWLHSKRIITALVLSGAVFSHILLDAMTSGGLGVAFFWPLNEIRHFLPWRPILVSPIGLKAFLTGRGLQVLKSELFWVWLPLLSLAAACFFVRRHGIKKN